MAQSQIQSLNPRHHEIKRLILLGFKNTEIAEKLGISAGAVSVARNSAVMKKALGEMHDKADDQIIDINKRIHELAPKALDVFEEVLEDELGIVDIKHKITVAKDLLDRDGFTPVQKRENLNVNTQLTADQINELKKRAAQAAVETACVIEEPEKGEGE